MPAAKSTVRRDVDEASRDVQKARTSLKKASARSDVLSTVDFDLLARSRGQIAHARDRFKIEQETTPRRSHHFPCPVDRNVAERHLQQAKGHVALGQEHVSRQRELIAQLERGGHDTYEAKKLLAQFEELQTMHIAHRDRLARQLTGDVR